jgi:hypothetical protein
VTAALHAMGSADDKQFAKYRRVLNRDRWSPWVLSQLLLGLIIRVFLSPDGPLMLVADETLERRRGRKIKYKGQFRAPIRSTVTHVTKALAIRWICLALLAPVPSSTRLWAFPFMAMPALGPKTSAKLKKWHRTLVEWAMMMIQKVRR